MIARIKEGWRSFAASEPGHRFQERYRRRQQSEHGRRDPGRLFYMVGGYIVAVGSLALGVLPGPQTLTFLVGVGMIAGEFRSVARLLDWAEVRARESGRWVGGIWRTSAAGKLLVISVAAICVAAALGGLISCFSPADFKPRLIHPNAWKGYSPKFAVRSSKKLRRPFL